MTAGMLLPQQASAQAPEKMSYQAVIRNSSNSLITSTTVGMQISILQGSSTGTAVYIETQTPTSNTNGLVTIEIGAGTVVSGSFATIDWTNGQYFIKTQTDPTGGTSYTITGTSQLLSVPYALHAKTADSLIGTNKKYLIEYISGDGQIYAGGGMPLPMVFKIFNITDGIYVTSLALEGLNLNSTANIGYEDSAFNNLNNYCGTGSNACYGGYYYISGTGLPATPFNLTVTVTLKYSNTGEVIDRYIINQYIQ